MEIDNRTRALKAALHHPVQQGQGVALSDKKDAAKYKHHKNEDIVTKIRQRWEHQNPDRLEIEGPVLVCTTSTIWAEEQKTCNKQCVVW